MHFVVQALAKGVKEGRLQAADITEDVVAQCLYTAPSSQVPAKPPHFDPNNAQSIPVQRPLPAHV